jgi:hypothetical protein
MTGFSHFANELWSLSTCILDVFQLKVRVFVRLSRIPNLSYQHNFVIEWWSWNLGWFLHLITSFHTRMSDWSKISSPYLRYQQIEELLLAQLIVWSLRASVLVSFFVYCFKSLTAIINYKTMWKCRPCSVWGSMHTFNWHWGSSLWFRTTGTVCIPPYSKGLRHVQDLADVQHRICIKDFDFQPFILHIIRVWIYTAATWTRASRTHNRRVSLQTWVLLLVISSPTHCSLSQNL